TPCLHAARRWPCHGASRPAPAGPLLVSSFPDVVANRGPACALEWFQFRPPLAEPPDASIHGAQSSEERAAAGEENHRPILGAVPAQDVSELLIHQGHAQGPGHDVANPSAARKQTEDEARVDLGA